MGLVSSLDVSSILRKVNLYSWTYMASCRGTPCIYEIRNEGPQKLVLIFQVSMVNHKGWREQDGPMESIAFQRTFCLACCNRKFGNEMLMLMSLLITG